MKILNSKKAAIEIEFNWVYIGVVGAIMLLLFIGLAMNMIKSSGEALERDVVTTFSDIFTSIQGGENSEGTTELFGLELNLDHNVDYCGEYRIGKATESIDFMPMFAPNTIKKKINSYSLGWDIPFRASYFVYLTGTEVMYVFLGIDNKLFDEFPEKTTKTKASSANLFVNQNYQKIRFISFESPEEMTVHGSTKKLPNNDVTYIYINEAEKSASYYTKSGDEFKFIAKTYYLDKPTLLAALYSESNGAYECNLKKALIRVGSISKVLESRTRKLDGNKCSNSEYQSAANKLGALGDAAMQASKADLTKAVLDNLASRSSEIDSINSNFNIMSCPTLY